MLTIFGLPVSPSKDIGAITFLSKIFPIFPANSLIEMFEK